MAEAIQDPIQDTIQDPIQGPIAAVDRQDGHFSFGEIHEYVVWGVYLEGFTKENKQALRKRSKFFPFYSDVYNTTIVSLHCYIYYIQNNY